MIRIPSSRRRRPGVLIRSIVYLLPVTAALSVLEQAHADIWSVSSSSNGTWSDAINWSDNTVGAPAPPGTADGIYTNVRMNIDGPLTYSAAEGTQTYDTSPTGGEGRSLGIATAANSTAGVLTLTGGNLILIQEGANQVAFIGNSAGSVGVLNLSGGNLTLKKPDATVDSTFVIGYSTGATGTVNINSGSTMSTDLVSFSAGGTATGTLNVNAGGILETRGIIRPNAGTATVNFDGGTLRLRGTPSGTNVLLSANINSAVIKGGGLIVDTNGFDGQLNKGLTDGGGNGGLTKNGAGTLTIQASGSNYTGATAVNTGTLQIGANGTTGNLGSGAVTVATGATLSVFRTDNVAQSAVMTAGITGGGNFVKLGGNIFIADLANTYAGTTSVNAGILRLMNGAALGGTASGTSVASGASLALAGVTISGEPMTISGTGLTTTIAGTEFLAVQRGALQGASGSNVWTGPVNVTSTNTRIGVQDGASLTISGNITDGGVGHTVIFRGGSSAEGAIILSGTGNSWGRTDVYGSSTRLGVNNALPTTAPLYVGTTGVNVSRFDLNGFNQTVAGLSQLLGAISSESSITNNGAADSTLTLDGSADLSYVGILSDGPSKKLSLVKNGSFTQSLTGTSTYTGPTTVNAGTLDVSGAIAGSTLTVNSGTLSGNGGTLGATSIKAGGLLSPGTNSIGTLNFSGSLTLTGTAAFEINKFGLGLSSDFANVTGGLTLGGTLTVSFAGDALTLGDSFNLFDAGSFSGSFAVLNLPGLDPGLSWNTSRLALDGTLTVVPEPGSVMLLLSGIALLGARRRRRVC